MIPNLDGMSRDELMEFWKRYHRPTRKDAAALIGDRRKGYIGLSAKVANYAANKAAAQDCRLRGDIQSALNYESFAERLYLDLPADLRW